MGKVGQMNRRVKNKKGFYLGLKSISKVELTKNDVIVIHCDEIISKNEAAEFTKYINEFFPNKVLLIGKNYRLDIVSEDIKEEKVCK